MTPKDKILDLKKYLIPEPFLGLTPQIVFIESCISANKDVAATSNATIPATRAKVLVVALLDVLIID